MSSFSSFFLCFLIDSCVLIVDSLEIVCGKQPHCNGATNRERKLTKTLFIVTVVSSLLTLALIIFRICYEVPLCRYSKNYFASKNRSVILFFVFVFVVFFSCKLTDQSKYQKSSIQKSFVFIFVLHFPDAEC